MMVVWLWNSAAFDPSYCYGNMLDFLSPWLVISTIVFMQARELFEILAREHGSMLHVYVRCLARSSEVDDLVQETLVTAWKNLDRFDRSKPFGPWLRGIARNLVLAHHRQSAGAVAYDPAWLLILEDRCHQLHHQRGDTLEEKLECLRLCIEQLPEPYRHTIRLRYQHEIAGEALAQRLQISFENVKKRLQRGKQWLHECLSGKLQSGEALS